MFKPRRNPRWLALLVLLSALAVLTPPPDHVIDTQVRLRVTRAMLDRGSLEIGDDPSFAHLTPQSPNGLHYSVYPVGQSLVLLPMDSLSRTVSLLAPVNAVQARALRDVLTAGLYFWTVNSLLALAAYGLFRVFRLSKRHALLGTVAAYFTSLWLIWSRSMQEETLAALLLASALYFGLRGARDGRFVRAGLAVGALFALLANVRYNAAIAAAGVLVWVLAACPDLRARAKLAACAGAMVLPGLLLAGWYNALRFGSALETGYQAYGASVGKGWVFKPADFGALLTGPDFGLLWFALPLFVLPLALTRARRAMTVGVFALAAGLVLHVIFLSGFFMHEPGGHYGYCGPRYLAHPLILLALPAWVGALRARRMKARLPLARWLAALALGAGALFQLAGVPLQAELERYQEALANYAEAPLRPPANVPRRFKNLAEAATGRLYEATVPSALRAPGALDASTAQRAQVACTPYFLPWRVPLVGRPVGGLPASLVAVASAFWWAALAVFAAAAALSILRLGPIAARYVRRKRGAAEA